MSIEIELKLAIAPRAVAGLRRHALLSGVPVRRDKLYGIYFDTPDFQLSRNRGAFRLRREGYHWVQTVKLDRGSVGGLSMRPEYEVRLAGKQPDFALLPEAARAAITPEVEARLAPVFVTDFQRTIWHIERPAGTVEVALDLGHIRAGAADLPVAEVELELKAGTGAVLFEIARELLAGVAMVPEYRSKALRGYGLVGAWQEMPAKAEAVALSRRLPAQEAWRRVLLSALDQLGRNLPGLIAGDDPEYLHQARVAVRRLRTMLGLGRSLGLEHDDWVADLRWFMAELSPARDWDVFVIETLAGVGAELPEPERLDDLRARAGRARAAAGKRARAAAGDRRLTGLVLAMGAALLEPRTDGPDLDQWAGQVLDRRLRKFRRLAGDFGRLDAAGRHQTRIAAKRLRYAGEAFAALSGKKAVRYLAGVAALQDGLGAVNDAAVAHRLLAALNRDGRDAYAVGLVEGFLAARAAARLAGVAAQVAGIAAVKPYWR
ncbi:CYTH and CHAD domain-containing protein [Parasulfuritortus cantonensis]|uniref:CYTH and CHAD domain-containing protein n=1 Tax=Parasulfuritortus cantonensis TaxID=2528202 RepID=A0A4R1BGY6_9PROT|nr:CYTH and CHAD domain-containing protein [Parasulfuritortus cantonensis]TCJ16515.1 CYTH and CHAD domain-containing protein [Parasulfuritortus cantonensis]